MMTDITFNAGFETDSVDVTSYSIESTQVGRHSRTPGLERYAKTPLWSADESVEQARYGQIQKRLIRLEAALYEDYGARIDPGSRDSLLRLFVACPSIRAPLISAQREGLLFATWRGNDGEELVIKFVSPKQIHFSSVAKSIEEPGKLDRSYGTSYSPLTFFVHYPVARRVAEN